MQIKITIEEVENNESVQSISRNMVLAEDTNHNDFFGEQLQNMFDQLKNKEVKF